MTMPMHRLASAVALAFSVIAAPGQGQAQAQAQQGGTIPEAAQGLWANGQCGEPAALIFFTSRYWALLPREGAQEMWRVERTAAAGAYTLAVADDPDQTRLVIRADGPRLETRTPGPKQPDDALPGDAPATQWTRCPSLPAPLAVLHGEGLSFLAALDGMETACGAGETAACIGAVVAWADVTRDGVLAPAEIARLVRGATYMAMLATGSELDQLAGAVGAGAVGGVATAYALIASFDYDGSGTLSQAELLQDRSPVPGLAGPAAPSAPPAAGQGVAGSAALAGQLGALRTLLDQLGPMLGIPSR